MVRQPTLDHPEAQLGLTGIGVGGLKLTNRSFSQKHTCRVDSRRTHHTYHLLEQLQSASGGVAMQQFTNVPQQTPNYYPPVAGLLMGESYHLIPGTTATSGISLTEDTGARDQNWIGHTMAANHLGPYSQEGVWQISEPTTAVRRAELRS